MVWLKADPGTQKQSDKREQGESESRRPQQIPDAFHRFAARAHYTGHALLAAGIPPQCNPAGRIRYHSLEACRHLAMPEPRITQTAPAPTQPRALTSPSISVILVQSLLKKAQAPAEWNLCAERFGKALERSAASRFRGAAASPGEIADYLSSLRLDDLALACACSDGNESAWEFFMQNFRAELYRAGRA